MSFTTQQYRGYTVETKITDSLTGQAEPYVDILVRDASGKLIGTRYTEAGAFQMIDDWLDETKSASVPIEDRYRLVKRTKRGSRIAILSEGNQAKVELVNIEDANDVTSLLNAAGITYTSGSGVGKITWEDTPVQLRSKRGPMNIQNRTYPGVTITFDFGELERLMHDTEGLFLTT